MWEDFRDERKNKVQGGPKHSLGHTAWSDLAFYGGYLLGSKSRWERVNQIVESLITNPGSPEAML